MNTFQATPSMKPLTDLKNLWRRKTDFSGRSRRSEFWWGNLGLLLSTYIGGFIWFIVLVITSSIMFPKDDGNRENVVFIGILLLFIVYFCLYTGLNVRRLHDTNRSGWWTAAHIVSSILSLLALLLWGGIMNAPKLRAKFYAATNTSITDSDFLMSKWGMLCLGTIVLFTATLIIFLITLSFCLQDSQKERNRFGESPKYIAQS